MRVHLRVSIDIQYSLGASQEEQSWNLLNVPRSWCMTFIGRQTTDQQQINHFTKLAMKPTEFREITQNNSHYAVQGRSRSPILVPIESPYTTSY